MFKKIACLLSIPVVLLSMSAMAQQSGGDRPKPPSFSEMDANGDGEVTLAEFSKMELPKGLDASTAFGHMDSNGDDLLSEDEVSNFKPPRR